jgi:integrase
MKDQPGFSAMPKGRTHPANALAAVTVRNLKEPGRYCDGNGLYLVVDPSGAKRWVLRTVIKGRRADIGLGSVRLVTLSEAREQATSLRKVARSNGDPLAQRRHERKHVPTFAEAAETIHTERVPSFRNSKHAAQWLQSLKTYVFPVFGSNLVDRIEPADVLRALSPIWLTKPETARRVKQRVEVVLSWAKAHGFVTGDNAAANVGEVLPRQADTKEHFAAMPYKEVPSFVARLNEAIISEPTRLGLELLILTALRTKEARMGEWCEIDWEASTWTIPAARQLKKKRPTPHIVPLSPRCIEILRLLRKLASTSPYIFPGKGGAKPISDMTFLMALRRLGLEITSHGFRSSFRDWAAEETNHRNEVIEKCLAHEIPNKVEAAYRRGDLLAKRLALMCDWSDYVAGKSSQSTSPTM